LSYPSFTPFYLFCRDWVEESGKRASLIQVHAAAAAIDPRFSVQPLTKAQPAGDRSTKIATRNILWRAQPSQPRHSSAKPPNRIRPSQTARVTKEPQSKNLISKTIQSQRQATATPNLWLDAGDTSTDLLVPTSAHESAGIENIYLQEFKALQETAYAHERRAGGVQAPPSPSCGAVPSRPNLRPKTMEKYYGQRFKTKTGGSYCAVFRDEKSGAIKHVRDYYEREHRAAVRNGLCYT
jgi:hypothetical protein